METSILSPFLLCFIIHLVFTEGSERILEQSSNITIRAGKDTSILCSTGSEVTSCVWLWEYPGRDHAPTMVAGFRGHGPGSANCSINLVNVSQIQTGWWTCRAQTANSTILESEPVFLQVFTGPIITFEMAPVNRTYSIGGPAELECRSAIPVQSCQWSFQQQGQSEPLVVTEGPPKDSRDCTLQLQHVSYEQVGAWRCGARTDDSDPFTFTDTVYIQVEHKEEAFPVEFSEEPTDTEMGVGGTGRLQCRVREEAHIEDCRWYWQPLGRSKAWQLLMREFLPVNNDCSIEFTNVTADPEGLWTCHVKPIHSKKFEASKSAKLTVRGDVALSVLDREVSVSEGEPLTIQCVAENPAKTCLWKRKALFETDLSDKSSWVTMRTFQPAGNESRDCSLRLEHAQVEHQGLWLCTIRFLEDKPFRDAMPTALIVKAPSKVRFVEWSRTQLAAENASVTLNCSTLSAVRECVWMWYEDESKVSQRLVKFNFTTDKNNKRNCNVVIPQVDRSLQGIWQCAVKYGDLNSTDISYAPPFSLTVVKTGPVTFREVSALVYTVPGTRSSLDCVLREPVEECLWLHQGNDSSRPQEFTRFQPHNFNNCSLRVTADMGSGLWTCGARNPGETNFTMANTTRMDLVFQGKVMTRSQVSSSDVLVLECQFSRPVSAISCDWIHPSEYNVFEFNSTGKYEVESSSDSGFCSLSFRPGLVDVGHWRCVFSVNNKQLVLGEASFSVLSSPQNVRLSWVVGILATVTLLLTVLLFVVVSCRLYQCGRSTKATVQLAKPSDENNKRYSDDPTKGINFSFAESPELLVDFSAPLPPDSHHYERVGRYVAHRPSFYQNVE